MTDLVDRHVRREIVETLASLRVAVLNGARQAGKTTLARDLIGRGGGTYVTLDEAQTFEALRADPRTFLSAYPKPLVIDEFQLGGDALLRAVKYLVDSDDRRGQFLLTGSTRFLTLPTISESLAGRVGIVDLWPYTQGEMAGVRETFLSRLLEPGAAFATQGAWPDRLDYLERICRGGFPEVQKLATAAARRRWFDAYVRTVTTRDVPGISRAQHVAELPKLLSAIAASTGRQLVVSELAEKVALARPTVDSTYLPLLETVFLSLRLPAWSRDPLRRLTRHPKAYVADTGVAAHLLRLDARALADPMCGATGPLVETFVVNELIRHQGFSEEATALSHYRTQDGAEVDVVVETPDGRVAGVEIKSSTQVTAADFRHLVGLRDRVDSVTGAEFTRGVVLHTGQAVTPFGDRLLALPIAALWAPPPA